MTSNTQANNKPTETRWQMFGAMFRGFVKTLKRALDPTTELTQDEAASTIFRFFRSRHVTDLRTIFVLAAFGLSIVVFANIFGGNASPSSAWLEWIKTLMSYIGAPLSVAGAIIAWAYLTASARLGIVDLFACEISTLCRVGTVVDVATRYVDEYRKPANGATIEGGEERAAPNFVSEENYFPVFESNSKDLQVLEAQVVIDITAFYTYMKAARDTLRKLSTVPGSASNNFQLSERHKTLEILIKMLFLGYESVRKAVHKLIEYEPTKTDVIIMILITELKCYSFLLKTQESNKSLYARIKLREANYKEIMDDIRKKVKENAHQDGEWKKASAALPLLELRYEEVQAAGHKKTRACADQRAAEIIVAPSC
jgi:hypothetical protein